MHLRLPVATALAFGLALPAAHAGQPGPSADGIPHSQWNAPQKPFRIYGNVWYVGPYGLTSLLVDTGQGLALFDGDLAESAPVIEAHIRQLSFRVRDVKWILNSHPHADHAGGIAALQAATGAQVLTSMAGARELALGGADPSDPQFGAMPYFQPVKQVRVVRDGEVVHLGNVAITAHYTPGHTAGSTSWTWVSCERRRCLRMAYADSLSAFSAPGYRFTDHPAYVANFRKGIAAVAALPCDILLTPHPDASGFWEKVARRKSPTDAAPLIDPQACRDYAATATQNLDARLAEEHAKAQ
ncbi:subclass B3 metallo-beta-lactamase [Rhodanobacter sp. DHG33]|uniref:subclass B3 metallo-beta-lactamase n=1 Tax=Rhodanobacter sp. DHG33 TaxID=2775921 RepID=UPI0017841D7E|nr:subclass B3 metallo-beta-lactamase [Rhodanobacter sp. DHG33]MBD8897700.1 subclass B3 metallo-beta-lactamase [Rhodanobacter sp. DHG33]